MIELYVEFEQQSGLDAVDEEVNVDELGDIDWGEDNSNSEEEFEANYEVNDENDDGDLARNLTVQNEADAIVSQYSFGVPFFMRTLDLEAMHTPKFSEYANMSEGNAATEDGEFSVGMEFGSRESVISAIKSYTIARGVDYTMYESDPQTFYAKCKGYGAGCDWPIRASLIRKKACWKIRRYNGKHMCTMGTISQDHAKLDSDTIAKAIRPLVEADPSIKVKSIIAEV
ncbi:Putative mutator sub-class protein [Arachis hypogaea]|nr:Putative mutator sub-class protein [Arachis hypogaea]